MQGFCSAGSWLCAGLLALLLSGCNDGTNGIDGIQRAPVGPTALTVWTALVALDKEAAGSIWFQSGGTQINSGLDLKSAMACSRPTKSPVHNMSATVRPGQPARPVPQGRLARRALLVPRVPCRWRRLPTWLPDPTVRTAASNSTPDWTLTATVSWSLLK